jgi:hypothetical protein
MTEHAYPPVTLELGGRTWELRLTWRRLRLMQEMAGDAVLGADNMGVQLWAMMGAPDDYSVEDVEEMVDVRDSERVLAAIYKAFGNDMPETNGAGPDAEAADAPEGKG